MERGELLLPFAFEVGRLLLTLALGIRRLLPPLPLELGSEGSPRRLHLCGIGGVLRDEDIEPGGVGRKGVRRLRLAAELLGGDRRFAVRIAERPRSVVPPAVQVAGEVRRLPGRRLDLDQDKVVERQCRCRCRNVGTPDDAPRRAPRVSARASI